ncbi:unnamed protein product, partial [Mesorhabditis belari]|uniref:Secreted protein n=1 Tax=Mesorhabditis belari TaxID=2138241 RepID=A0AAF3EAU5_9BILA
MVRLLVLAATVTLSLAAPNQKIIMPCLGLLDPTSTDVEPCKGPELWAAHQQWTPLRKRACTGSDPLIDPEMCTYLNGLKPVDMECFALVTNAYYKMGYPPPCPKNLTESSFNQPVTSMSDNEVQTCLSDAWSMFTDLCGNNPSLLSRTETLYNTQMETLNKCVAANPDVGPTCKHEFELQQVAQFNVFQNQEDGTHADPVTILERSLKTFRNFYQIFQEYLTKCQSIWTCGFKSTFNGLKSPFTQFAYKYICKELDSSNGTFNQADFVAKVQAFSTQMIALAKAGKSN